MTKVVYDSTSLGNEVIKNINNAISGMRKIEGIVSSLNMPSLSSSGYLNGIPKEIEEIISSCNKNVDSLQTSMKRFNTLVDTSCVDVSKCEVPDITAKNFFVNLVK